MTDDALEPSLTELDLKVLAAVSECGGDEWRKREVVEAVSLWQIAEAVNTTRMDDLTLTLNGLTHLGYVTHAPSSSREREVYWRTRCGDEAVDRSRVVC